MQKIKIISVCASFFLSLILAVPLTLAEDQYLPDVENIAGESISGGVKLMWDLVEGADSYTIYYGIQSISEDGANYENNILLGNVNEYALEDLMPDIVYYFAVAADDSTGTYLGSYNYSEEISAVAGSIEEPLVLEEPVEEPPVLEEPVEEPPVLEEPEEIDISALEALLRDGHTSAGESAADPENLPQSGPATAALALVSSAGAYFWRKFRK